MSSDADHRQQENTLSHALAKETRPTFDTGMALLSQMHMSMAGFSVVPSDFAGRDAVATLIENGLTANTRRGVAQWH
jgi:hypothetical protein